jgi:hypothetical protein
MGRYMPVYHTGTWGERRYTSYSFLTSALDGGEWSALRHGRGMEPRYPSYRRLGCVGHRDTETTHYLFHFSDGMYNLVSLLWSISAPLNFKFEHWSPRNIRTADTEITPEFIIYHFCMHIVSLIPQHHTYIRTYIHTYTHTHTHYSQARPFARISCIKGLSVPVYGQRFQVLRSFLPVDDVRWWFDG